MQPSVNNLGMDDLIGIIPNEYLMLISNQNKVFEKHIKRIIPDIDQFLQF